MNEVEIQSMQVFDLVKSETVYEIVSESEEIREQLKAVYLARMSELKADNDLKSQVKKMFKAFEKADKELAEAYKRENAKKNNNIQLSYDGKGKPLATIDNFLLILRNDLIFDSLRFNQLSCSPEHIIVNGKLEKWQDKDDSQARFYIERKYKIHSREKLDDALRIFFAEREYHPIKNIIEAVEWDGVPRIQTLFIKWLKCEDTPYIREVTRLVFAGGIHRLYNAGCKFDDVAVLIGKQGEGKSSFIRWLAIRDEYFTEVNEFEGQKGIEALEGAWICELSELLALTKAREVENVKSYITKLVDRYRRPFDRRVTDHKRMCIFIGSTNKEMFLTDRTGNRRFYPIKVYCSGYDLHDHKEEIQADILQAWAEAKYLYDKGELPPYADRNLLEDIRRMQGEAVEEDYRVGMIESYVADKSKVCVLELWKFALDNDFSKPTRKDSNEITLILQSFGEWKRGKIERHPAFGNQLFWERIKPLDFSTIDDDFEEIF